MKIRTGIKLIGTIENRQSLDGLTIICISSGVFNKIISILGTCIADQVVPFQSFCLSLFGSGTIF